MYVASKNHILCLIVAFLFFAGIFFFRKPVVFFIKETISFIKEILKSRFLLFQLTKRDFQNKYLGTYFGLPWAFIQPIISILVIWYVFTYGFKTGSTSSGAPFILWLIVGMIAWFFVSECLRSGSDVLIEYSYLLKKVSIRAAIIPLVKVLSALVIHFFFIIVMIILLVIGGQTEYIYWIQILYYLPATLFLLLGFIYLVSAINVFVRDMSQFVGVFLQVFFWFTPIFWDINTIPESNRVFFTINPFYYVIKGYRESFVDQKWFFNDIQGMIQFWVVAVALFLIGITVFKRLKPHFGDVL